MSKQLKEFGQALLFRIVLPLAIGFALGTGYVLITWRSHV